MLVALARQRNSDDWQRDDGRYIPHPTTWLNGRRWEDEPPSSAVTADPASDRWAQDL